MILSGLVCLSQMRSLLPWHLTTAGSLRALNSLALDDGRNVTGPKHRSMAVDEYKEDMIRLESLPYCFRGPSSLCISRIPVFA
jgi:hypothetical protein